MKPRNLIFCLLLLLTSGLQILPLAASEPTLEILSVPRNQGEARLPFVLFNTDMPRKNAIVFFRGWPGIANLKAANDGNKNLSIFRLSLSMLNEAGIALVIVDCPSDQNFLDPKFDFPLKCDDEFRSSETHTNDIRLLIEKLRHKYKIEKIFIMGHSYGTISSKWLALNLKNLISGSIHSASQTRGDTKVFRYGISSSRINLDKITTPVLHIHHHDDECKVSPYDTVKNYSKNNLITVYGGGTTGDPCGSMHHHSYENKRSDVVKAIIKWTQSGLVIASIGKEN